MRNRNLLLFATVLVAAAGVLYWMKEKPVYGNDVDSISQIILEQERHGEITILEIKDVQEYRVVTYLHNETDSAMMTFRKNARGNYEWIQSEKRAGELLAIFHASLLMEVEEGPPIVFVTTADNRVAAVQVDVNEFSEKIELPVGEPSVTWLNIPKAEVSEYQFIYTYFDEAGKVVENE
ncbi:hypothetical protein AB1K83_11385 [Sporosarcina sp. 179-K 3D1 HS]|uniref:hypothetical protein n=1 Tax=Sporosarcina sp. 179-K 3D1 HS TaxID=3232169 RepID=UPI0039A04F8E